MRNPFDLEPHTTIPHDGSYITSYPHMLSYFAERDTFTEADVVRGAHMVYGWMPTILDINPGTPPRTDLQQAADYLTKARHQPLTHADLSALKRLVNNSMVGASKLLHFVAPQRHAVWDSKVFAFCFDRYGYEYEVNNVRNYENYLGTLNELMIDLRFADFHASVCTKIGYPVSGLRALELVMFLNAPERKRKE